MNSLDRHPDILRLARSLGIDQPAETTQAILAVCVEKLAGWMSRAGPVRSIRELQDLACAKLNLVFEQIRSEADLRRIVDRYVREGEVVFASLPALFDPETYATLIRRRALAAGGPPSYVAVIDCRGRKASRGFFSRWHEIAHLLTLNGRGLEQPVHRSTSTLSPVERLMDRVAGEIAFCDALFRPVLAAELGVAERLTFSAVDRVRQRYAAEASFEATLIACVRRLARPALYLEAGLGLTRSEEAEFDREPVPARRPRPRLRVRKVVSNERARAASFHIPPNLAVPESSILSGLFFGGQALARRGESAAVEELGGWRRSDGRSVGSGRMHVQGRSLEDRVLGLVFPLAEPPFLGAGDWELGIGHLKQCPVPSG